MIATSRPRTARQAWQAGRSPSWKLFDVPDKLPPGQRAVDLQKQIDEFVDRYHKRFPAAVRCLQDDAPR
jgi:hypothetical protein